MLVLYFDASDLISPSFLSPLPRLGANVLVGVTLLIDNLARTEGIRDDMEILNWADAMGIGAFCCIGAQAGIRKVRCVAIDGWKSSIHRRRL